MDSVADQSRWKRRPLVVCVINGDDIIPRITIAALRGLHSRLADPALISAANAAAVAEVSATVTSVVSEGLGRVTRLLGFGGKGLHAVAAATAKTESRMGQPLQQPVDLPSQNAMPHLPMQEAVSHLPSQEVVPQPREQEATPQLLSHDAEPQQPSQEARFNLPSQQQKLTLVQDEGILSTQSINSATESSMQFVSTQGTSHLESDTRCDAGATTRPDTVVNTSAVDAHLSRSALNESCSSDIKVADATAAVPPLRGSPQGPATVAERLASLLYIPTMMFASPNKVVEIPTPSCDTSASLPLMTDHTTTTLPDKTALVPTVDVRVTTDLTTAAIIGVQYEPASAGRSTNTAGMLELERSVISSTYCSENVAEAADCELQIPDDDVTLASNSVHGSTAVSVQTSANRRTESSISSVAACSKLVTSH